MSGLITTPNLEQPDEFYACLLAVHEERSEEESQALNARLILTLANHVGAQAILEEALQVAKMA
ncbi:DUF2783 domain-containing protein [Pseudooceanicola sp. CBS1P-1]|uniref:DUF2783 domain-containing protein n=1 Tax=Pseudooceanicola albus TaxID=2692189 RepID=A0A6L7G9I0_9RHOB|nr:MULTISPECIES: DUF2783 domain-containing protein [Pseudooceanicola]MBT9384312.1 DUF2783 domain-containing protein [Pseudooceanicola endophyticus]MXN19950.1 DUF2783 domain-containing protein [Pseudooceanicola albus]